MVLEPGLEAWLGLEEMNVKHFAGVKQEQKGKGMSEEALCKVDSASQRAQNLPAGAFKNAHAGIFLELLNQNS